MIARLVVPIKLFRTPNFSCKQSNEYLVLINLPWQTKPALAVTEIDRESVKLEPISLEEIRRQARENWLQLRQQMVSETKAAGHSKDAARGTEQDQDHSIHDDLDE
jgi:hypothetical protein